MIVNKLLNKIGIHVVQSNCADRIPWMLKMVDQSESVLGLIGPELIRKFELKYFIQVGANDGEKGDPFEKCLRESNLRGILVEPQPLACGRLRERYSGNDKIIIEELAVGESEGTFDLYYLDSKKSKPKFDYHYDQLASGDREHLKQVCRRMGIDLPINKIKVNSVTWSGLLKRHKFPNPDIVLVDTEGMDDLIINQINLEVDCPMLIQFEYIHIPARRLEICSSRLKQAGYTFLMTEYDLLCIHGKARL